MPRTIVLAAALLLPLLAARADRDDKKAVRPVRVGSAVGKVMNVYEDKKRLRLQVSYPVTRFDAGAAGQVAQYQQQMAAAQQSLRLALLRRDPNGVAQARQQLLQAQAQALQASARLYKTEAVTREVEVQATDDVVVRISQPKAQFDDKGVVKRLTKAELAELKGDPKLSGYKAEFSDLGVEQVVRVTLVRKAGGEAPRPRRAKGKKKEEDGPPDGLADELPLVSLIEILHDPPPK